MPLNLPAQKQPTYTQIQSHSEIVAKHIDSISPPLLDIIKRSISLNGSIAGVSSKTARENIQRALRNQTPEMLMVDSGITPDEQQQLAQFWMTFDASLLKSLIRHIFPGKAPMMDVMNTLY